MIRIYDERIYIFENFYIPLELMSKGEVMLLYNLILEGEIDFLDTEDCVIESKPILINANSKIRECFLYIAKKFYLIVIIINEINKQCKKKGLGKLIEKILIEELTLKWNV
ncbi:unnamed protein product [marine sediment metagenome]|uniref:Uncharacterized protein n=1 Tax=marine sediment metagenome TaxID=412755 RepID=X1VIH4_9ZZZZ